MRSEEVHGTCIALLHDLIVMTMFLFIHVCLIEETEGKQIVCLIEETEGKQREGFMRMDGCS